MSNDLGFFGPDSVSWRVHAESVLWLAGVRAVLLQALHPRVMAGVAQNSDYQGDPWGRLMRTAQYVGTVVFGTKSQARKAAARVRGVHARLTAHDAATGETYALDQPDLLRWVHVTEVESFVSTARRAGAPLSDADVKRYYTEQLVAAELIGIDPATVPVTRRDIDDYYAELQPELALTREAASVAKFVAFPPLPYGLGFTPVRPAWIGVAGIGFGILPRWARRRYLTPGLPITDLTATISLRAFRRASLAVPERLRTGPIYRAAMERVAAAA